ncbi:polysaccharide deacetylase family protein [Pelagibacterales bacterium SAG-MED39]|nr:polysaccharide deacetylase family protein [Pelagibacterales bacterium SAG-MED39]
MKKIFFFAASIISLFILQLSFLNNSNSEEKNSKSFSDDSGVLSLMYHRFNENKYPSTNIRMNIFDKQMQMIKNLGYEFYDPKLFEKEFNEIKKSKRILITIDDGFQSFYEEAWPYLRENNIPFILFVSTEPIGKKGYMSWSQILEIERSKLGIIGHHSHTHEYLIDMKNEDFINDIETASKIFKEKLGYVPSIFSYPFGEYSKFMKNYISRKFNIGFGQHSGVIDLNKDKYELPRFPINEKYGDLKRFKSVINYAPLEYHTLYPEEKKINDQNNPPELTIKFFKEQKNINNITCFSNDGGNWKKTNLNFKDNNMEVKFDEKFLPRRGRINCSLNDNGNWRWFGTQFTIKN